MLKGPLLKWSNTALNKSYKVIDLPLDATHIEPTQFQPMSSLILQTDMYFRNIVQAVNKPGICGMSFGKVISKFQIAKKT